MSLLPGQIIPASMPIGKLSPDGKSVLIDENWWLFLYNIYLNSVNADVAGGFLKSFNGRTVSAAVPTTGDYKLSMLSDVSPDSWNDRDVLAYSSALAKWTASPQSEMTIVIETDNGFSGTVLRADNEQQITLTTTVSGMLKGVSDVIEEAVSGTDYSAGTASLSTGILKSTTATGALTIAVAADFPILNQDTTGNAATVTTNADLTGPVTSTGNATAVTANAITNAMLAEMPTDTIKGNNTAATANAIDLTAGQVTAMLDAYAGSAQGVVPAGSGGTTNYLREDGTWALPPNSGGTVTSVSVVDANGFTGTVATDTTTPAITLNTTISGILKGNGTAISEAISGTDYSNGTSSLTTGILKSTTTTGALTIAVAADFPTLNQNTTGSAGSLSPGAEINGVNFTGASGITVTAAAGTLTGNTLASNVTASSLTRVGDLSSLNIAGYLYIKTTQSGTASSSPNLNFVAWNGTAATGVDLYSDSDGNLHIETPTGAVFATFYPTGNLTVVGDITADNFSGSSSGTNTGDQTITLTGDVTGSGTGSFAATVENAPWSKVTATPTTLAGYGITDGLANPMTTAGDIIIGGASGTPERLAIGGSNKFLTVSSGAPSWSDVFQLFAADTRNDNNAPSYYYNAYAQLEFKYASVVGAPGSAQFGSLLTVNSWYDSTGSAPVQMFFSSDGIFGRVATSDTSWSAWQTIINSAVPTLSSITINGGTVYQNTSGRRMTIIDNENISAGGSVVWSLGPSSPPTAMSFTQSTSGIANIPVPPGWYYSRGGSSFSAATYALYEN